MRRVIFIIITMFMISGCDDEQNISTCGDGVLDPGEDCDLEAYSGGQNCRDHGYNSGLLHCNADCTVDMTECTESGQCGDSVVQTDYEKCDGMDLNGETCVTQGYAGGELGCTADCRFDQTGCYDESNCGNSVKEGLEECDGNDSGNIDCSDLGYYGGVLSCDSNCNYDLSSCETFGRCGDGDIQSTYGEDCEGVDLNGSTCADLGYYGGTLYCDSQCNYDTSDCETAGMCGDGIIQSSYEECEDTNQNGATCESLGFTGGVLSCKNNCEWDKSECISPTIGVMISVPAGTFQRDSVATNLSTVSSFKMSPYEITRAQFLEVMGTDPSDTTFSSGTSDPVQSLNWYHAIAFCNKLSLLEGLKPVYTVSGVNFSTLTFAQIPLNINSTWNDAVANWNADGYRLPTEMEWMWAAMGADSGNPGAVNTTGYLKAFAGSTGSNSIGDYVWYDGNSSSMIHPVGSKLPNELGLYDMSGNVYEWNWDWHDSYPSGSVSDYQGPALGSNRFVSRRWLGRYRIRLYGSQSV